MQRVPLTLKQWSLSASLRGAAKHEKDAEISIQTYNENGSKGWNLSIAEIHLGDIDSSNALAAEIVRRFNEFPEELKR